MWDELAVNSGVRRGRRGVAEVQTGYCDGALTEMWVGAKPFFAMVYDDVSKSWRARKRELWRSKHYFYIFLYLIDLMVAHDI